MGHDPLTHWIGAPCSNFCPVTAACFSVQLRWVDPVLRCSDKCLWASAIRPSSPRYPQITRLNNRDVSKKPPHRSSQAGHAIPRELRWPLRSFLYPTQHALLKKVFMGRSPNPLGEKGRPPPPKTTVTSFLVLCASFRKKNISALPVFGH